VTLTCGMTLRCAPLQEGSAFNSSEQRAKLGHCGIEPPRDVATDVLERAGARGGVIELGGKPRTVIAERMQLGSERRLLPVGDLAPLDRGRERIERERKTSAGSLDRVRLGHRNNIPDHSPAFEATKNRRGYKQLEIDLYVIPRPGVNARSQHARRVH